MKIETGPVRCIVLTCARLSRHTGQPSQRFAAPLAGYPGGEVMRVLVAAVHAHCGELGSWALGQILGALGQPCYVSSREQLAGITAGEGSISEGSGCWGCMERAHTLGTLQLGAWTPVPFGSHPLQRIDPGPCALLALPATAFEPKLRSAEQARETTAALSSLARLGFDPGEKFAAACMWVVEADGGRDQLLLSNCAWALSLLKVGSGAQQCQLLFQSAFAAGVSAAAAPQPFVWVCLSMLLHCVVCLQRCPLERWQALLALLRWEDLSDPGRQSVHWLTSFLLVREQHGDGAAPLPAGLLQRAVEEVQTRAHAVHRSRPEPGLLTAVTVEVGHTLFEGIW